MKTAIINALDACLQTVGMRLLPAWRVQWWTAAQSFDLRGREYACFYHRYNCGWPPYVSERTVELALADAWLSAVQDSALQVNVTEIGAVTPYYWPRRVATIIDPYDPHHLVTHRKSMFDIDLSGQPVLAVSTFEHIGTDDYHANLEQKTSADALQKLFDESPAFLVTVPLGYSQSVDRFLAAPSAFLPPDVSLGLLKRTSGPRWEQIDRIPEGGIAYGDAKLKAKFPGTSIGTWANAVAVLERGNALQAATPTALVG